MVQFSTSLEVFSVVLLYFGLLTDLNFTFLQRNWTVIIHHEVESEVGFDVLTRVIGQLMKEVERRCNVIFSEKGTCSPLCLGSPMVWVVIGRYQLVNCRRIARKAPNNPVGNKLI